MDLSSCLALYPVSKATSEAKLIAGSNQGSNDNVQKSIYRQKK